MSIGPLTGPGPESGSVPPSPGTNDPQGRVIPITKRARDGQHQSVLELVDAPPDGTPSPERRLGEVLVAEGLISEDQLRRALAAQNLTPAPLGTLLVSQGAVHEDQLTLVLSVHLGAPIADLKHGDVDADVARSVPEDFARRHLVLPLRRDNGHMAVAMGDPSNLSLLNDLRLITGHSVAPYIASPSDILEILSRVHTMRPRLQEAARTRQESRPQLGFDRAVTLELANITSTSPAVEIVNLLITQGLRDRASDIHIEPQKEYLRVRFPVSYT